ncbi:MAG: hypothetical protein GXZ11_01685 [Tissierellia bacterium]|nr:hypothetical protein [Tissierellia bacterium]
MSFLIHKLFLMIRAKKWIYILLILEIAVGVGMLSFAFNIFFSLQAKKTEILKYNRDIVIDVSKYENTEDEDLEYSFEDYVAISKIIDGDVIFKSFFNQSFIKDGTITEFPSFLVDFEKLGISNDVVYFGDKAYEFLFKNEDYGQIDDFIEYTDLKVLLNSDSQNPMVFKTDLIPINSEEELKTIVGNETINTDKIILFPIYLLPEFQSSGQGCGKCVMEFVNLNKDTINEDIQKIQNYFIKNKSSNTRYNITKPMVNFEYSIAHIRKISDMVKCVGLLLMLIIYLGQGLIFDMIYRKRHSSIGISLACGLNPINNYIELFGEILLINLTGMVSGLAIGYVATRLIGPGIMTNFTLGMHYMTVVVVFSICLIASLLTLFYINRGLTGKNPSQLLRNE